jgi:hypothetical protein
VDNSAFAIYYYEINCLVSVTLRYAEAGPIRLMRTAGAT